MNVFLLERQQARLEEESERTGSSVAELIRRAIDVVYPSRDSMVATIGDLVSARGDKLPMFGEQTDGRTMLNETVVPPNTEDPKP
jgi:hypothetical protein